MANKLPALSVVVVTYRREQILCDTLGYLLDQEYPDWELIVVDQSPDHEPATWQFLEQVSGRLRYVHTDEVGMSHARNAGLEAARGEVLLFCDDDLIPAPKLLAKHARHYADAQVGGVTGPVRFEPVRAGAPKRLRPGGAITRAPYPSAPVDTDTAYGCNVSYRKYALRAIGGFDEGFIYRAHHEDSDVSLRVRALGYRLLYDPEARIEHLTFPSGGSRANQAEEGVYTFGWYHNNAYFFGKHMPVWQMPIFLRYQLGHLLYRQVWQQRRVGLLRPAIGGLVRGYREGLAARRQMFAHQRQAES